MRPRKAIFLCECGEEFEAYIAHVKGGSGCGCKMGNPTHENTRVTNTPEYTSWCQMKSRCLNPNNPSYPVYGGRGITICDRWINSFENFLSDMGKKPSALHSLDRYPDNNSGYGPANCRWATRTEQQRNYSLNRLIDFNGETKCLSEWAEIHNLPSRIVWFRLFRLGWTPEKCFSTEVRQKAKKTVTTTVP